MGDITLASQIDDESELFERFEKFKDERGHTNRSEALRAALRRGLDEYEQEKTGMEVGYTRFEDLMLKTSVVLAAIVVSIPLFESAGLISWWDAAIPGAIYLLASALLALVADFRRYRRVGHSNIFRQFVEVSG